MFIATVHLKNRMSPLEILCDSWEVNGPALVYSFFKSGFVIYSVPINSVLFIQSQNTH